MKEKRCTLQAIQTLYKKYGTPPHVQRHMRCVAHLAVRIAKMILDEQKKKKSSALNFDLDLNLIKNLALVHDICKPLSFRSYEGTPKTLQRIWKRLRTQYPKEIDTDIASHLLKKEGYTTLARAVVSQVFDAPVSRARPLRSLEEKIVYYADKRIAHTKKVSLRERLDEGYTRYLGGIPRKKSKRLLVIEKKIFNLEKELSKLAGKNLQTM